MWEYRHTDELYHYGVPGMKWGHRKSQSVMTARNAYKSARKDLRKASVKKLFSKSTWIAGHNNVQAAKKATAKINALEKKKEKAAFNLIDKQAKYAYDKKLAKTGSKAKAEKAALKVHTKAFGKGGGGLVGSIADAASGGGNTRYYKHLSKTKGKKYADKVEKKYGKQVLTSAAVGLAASIGLSVAAKYMD